MSETYDPLRTALTDLIGRWQNAVALTVLWRTAAAQVTALLAAHPPLPVLSRETVEAAMRELESAESTLAYYADTRPEFREPVTRTHAQVTELGAYLTALDQQEPRRRLT